MAELDLPACETLDVRRDGPWLTVTLNRPGRMNAMNQEMVGELHRVLDLVAPDRSIRAVVLRGANGAFSAGGDIRRFREAVLSDPVAGADPLAVGNRRGGALYQKLNALPQAVVAVVEGPAVGGGFGIVCCADIAIASEQAHFALPETSLGTVPAQIAAFVVQRIGLTEARRLMLTAARVDAYEARRLGLVHYVEAGKPALETRFADVLAGIRRTAPGAVARAKGILMSLDRLPLGDVLDRAAQEFAAGLRSAEGREGVAAFLEKRAPAWSQED